MSTWTINGNSPEFYGVTITQIEFAPAAASSVLIDAATDFDATESFPHNSTVTILRDGLPFFRGRSRQIEKSGDDSNESVRYIVEDVWAELERITYQEAWQIRQPDYVGPAFLPTVILGISANGVRINVGQQITEALTFAAARGAALTVGSVPAGMMLWPSKVVGMSCAAVIRECLKYYPDWIPWIDHSTSPPTFHVTPRASAQTAAIPVTDCRSVDVRKMDDRIPTGVRICYITAGLIGDNVYRTLSVDQFPSVPTATRVAPAEPGVIVTSVELAGMQMQIQKQQVQTRSLPTSESGAVDYLKIKYPAIKDIPAEKINIKTWTTAVIPSAEDESPPIDEKLVRIPGGSRTDLPRELVKGSITEWMRKKVGRVLVEMTVEAVDATDEQKAKIEALPQSFTVVATDAVTKTYRGVSSFTAAEDVPVGIAQAFYENLLAAARFEGQIIIEDEEVYPGRLHGKKINLTGSTLGEWATMSAPIHRVIYDLKNGRTTVNFGPNPELSFHDFLDYLRLLNKRPHNVFSQTERAGDRLGDESEISAEGDTVGPYDAPETVTSGAAKKAVLLPFEVYGLKQSAGLWKARVKKGFVVGFDPRPSGSSPSVTLTPTNTDAEITVSATLALYCKVLTNKNDFPVATTGAGATTIVAMAGTPTTIHAQPDPNGVDGVYFYKLADFETDGENLRVKSIHHIGGSIIHRPGRVGRHAKFVIEQKSITTDGTIVSGGADQFAYFRDGLYVGETDPADGVTQDEVFVTRLAGA